MGLSLVVGLSLYLLGFAFFTYACIIADPATSPTSRLLTEWLPGFFVAGLRRIVGPKVMNFLEDVSEYALVLVYLVIVLGCWSIMFTYGYAFISSSQHVSNLHEYIGYLVFVACMSSWRYAMRTSPGIITSRTMAKFDNYPYDNLLFSDRICPTVKIRKLARSKYDRISKRHIPRFDHFCGWINNPVGEENYRHFLLFLTVHVFMCWYGTVVTAKLFWGEIVDGDLLNATFFVVQTGAEVKASKIVVAQYLLAKHFYLMGVFFVMTVMAVVLTWFFGYHLYISARGMTTNEYFKWKEVRKWHRWAKRRYEEAKKKGLVMDSGSKKSITVSDEADIGCAGPTNSDDTAASSASDTKRENGLEEEIIDPGPFPKNIYDQGIINNFEEIIYPRSLREDALQRWKKSLGKGGTKAPAEEVEPGVNEKRKAV